MHLPGFSLIDIKVTGMEPSGGSPFVDGLGRLIWFS